MLIIETVLDKLYSIIDGKKQDKLTAGDNIQIDTSNTISATDTTYTAGEGIDITDNIISATDGMLYARCTTTAATATKQITLEGHTLVEGDVITIRFSYSNTAASPNIKVNGGDSYAITYAGAHAVETTTWRAGQAVQFLFDGSYFIMEGGMASTSFWGLTKLTSSLSTESATIAASATAVKNLNDGKQDKLTAGTNITIDSDNVISATDTTYSAGTNIQINGTVISATDTTYTAGANIQIDGTVISATDTTYTAGENIQIDGTTISATDTTYTAGRGIQIRDNTIMVYPDPKVDIPTKIVAPDTTATFSVADMVQESSDSFTYQWQVSTTDGQYWQDSSTSGCKTNTIKVSATTARNGYQYRCKITGTSETIVSQPAKLIVLS